MRPYIRVVLAMVVVVAAFSGCARPKVVQGTVVAADEASRVIVVQDELPPNAELTFDVSEAEMNAKAVPGDLVRIAYDEDGKTLRATRVMRLSRPKESKP